MRFQRAIFYAAVVAAMSFGAPAIAFASSRGACTAFAPGLIASKYVARFSSAPVPPMRDTTVPALGCMPFSSGRALGTSRFLGGRKTWGGVVLNQSPAGAGGTGGNASSTFDVEAVGAAGNLRFKGTGFKAPESKPSVDVAANFKVKPKSERSDLESPGGSGKLGELVDFPCQFQIKVVGARQGEFVEDILDSVGNVIKQDGRALPHSYRDKGKWRSITLKVPVQSAEELYKVYDAIDKDPRVKFKF